MSSCFSRLCSSRDCKFLHAGDAGFVPSPCPFGSDCGNGEACKAFHESHAHTLRNCGEDVVRRFLSCCRHPPHPTTTPDERLLWRKLVRNYIANGTYDPAIDRLRNGDTTTGGGGVGGGTKKKTGGGFRVAPRTSRPRSGSSGTGSGSSRSGSRKRSRSRSRSRSPSRSPSRSRSRSRSRSPSRSPSRSSSRSSSSSTYSYSLFDETVGILRDLTTSNLQTVLVVAKALHATQSTSDRE
jgi:hypothetical protein